jgi:NAD(P)-dependent dehydrogenase (short-subunit alcohol dehydrogenase family)
MSIDFKTVILTGASRGIGHATVRRFNAEGWRVISCSREDIPEECRRDPNVIRHIVTDLADMTSLSNFVAEAQEILGDAPLDALVNNAAISPKTATKGRLGVLDGDVGRWRRVFELNLFVITSIAGHEIHPFAGSAYSVSKAALSALTREMAAEFADKGVRVNAIAPGEIETAMIDEKYQSLIPRIPMHRMGQPEEVASTVYRLCTDDFAYVTGTELFVTGGQHLV